MSHNKNEKFSILA